MGQKISVHTAWLMIVPLHLMNSMGENYLCVFSTLCLVPCVIYSLLCVICFSLFLFVFQLVQICLV